MPTYIPFYNQSAAEEAGEATVTSVGLTSPLELVVSGSPVETVGNLGLAWADQTGNTVLASPSDGSPGSPAFRPLLAADLPLDVAYTDVANTFTQTQTVTDGTITPFTTVTIDEGGFHVADLNGNVADVYSYYQQVSDGVNSGSLNSNTLGLFGVSPQTISLDDSDTPGYGQIQTKDGSLDVSLNLYSGEMFALYYNNGPATNIHQDVDGSIHLQVAPPGVGLVDPITWSDALVVNNDASVSLSTNLTIDDGAGNYLFIGISAISGLDDADNNFTLQPDYFAIALGDGSGINYFSPSLSLNSDSSTYTEISINAVGVDFGFNKQDGGAHIFRDVEGPATNIHQDIDGSIRLQVGPTGTQDDFIFWTDILEASMGGVKVTGGSTISSGTGVPTRPGGVDPTAGDLYVRKDTPGVATQNLYSCTVGGATPTWVGIA